MHLYNATAYSNTIVSKHGVIVYSQTACRTVGVANM